MSFSRVVAVAVVVVSLSVSAGCTSTPHGLAPTNGAAKTPVRTKPTIHPGDGLTSSPALRSNPDDLYGATWTVTDLHGLDGAADTIPSVPVTFGFARSADVGAIVTSSIGCSLATASITPGQIAFKQSWVGGLTTRCAGGPTIEESNFIFGVLSGTAQWTIAGDTLAITNGSGSVELNRDRSDVPTPTPDSSRPATSLVAVQLITEGGVSALNGTLEISGPHLHRTISVGLDGYYSTRLPAGTYTFTGYSPHYNGGHGLCKAPAPITLNPPHTAPKIYVVCNVGPP